MDIATIHFESGPAMRLMAEGTDVTMRNEDHAVHCQDAEHLRRVLFNIKVTFEPALPLGQHQYDEYIQMLTAKQAAAKL